MIEFRSLTSFHHSIRATDARRGISEKRWKSEDGVLNGLQLIFEKIKTHFVDGIHWSG